MQYLNEASVHVFQKLVNLMGEESHLKLDNSNGIFMPVVIEKIADFEFKGFKTVQYSIAHYFEQNGDLVPDPDITFFVLKDRPEMIFPASYQDQHKYDVIIWQDDDDVWKYNPLLGDSMVSFCNVWLKNIKRQQNL